MKPIVNTSVALPAALLASLSGQPAGAIGHYDGERLSVPEVRSTSGQVFRDVVLERRGTRFSLRRLVQGNERIHGNSGAAGFYSGKTHMLNVPGVSVVLGGTPSYHDLELLLVEGPEPLIFEWEAASPPLDRGPPEVHGQLQALLDQAVDNGLVGVSLTIRGGGLDFSASAGSADRERGTAMTPAHKLGIGSIGKTLLGATLARMHDRGMLQLDAPITRWLDPAITGRLPGAGAITLRHLLSHTSGVFDYGNDAGEWLSDAISDPERDWSLEDILEYALDRPLHFSPGTRYRYSNTNYVLAGLIVEAVTGRPYYRAIRRHVLTPLGLEDTFNAAEMPLAKVGAHSYLLDQDSGEYVDVYEPLSRLSVPAAGMFSTPEDLVVLIRGLFESDAVLNGNARREFLTPPAVKEGDTTYGLGIGHGELGGGLGRIWGHEGKDFGYRANLFYLEQAGIGIALCANSAYDPASDAAFDHLFEQIIAVLAQRAADAARW